MVALNVSDIKNIKQIDAYPYPLPVISNNSSSTTSSSTNPTDGSITSGGKAGIAVGSVIGVSVEMLLLFSLFLIAILRSPLLPQLLFMCTDVGRD